MEDAGIAAVAAAAANRNRWDEKIKAGPANASKKDSRLFTAGDAYERLMGGG